MLPGHFDPNPAPGPLSNTFYVNELAFTGAKGMGFWQMLYATRLMSVIAAAALAAAPAHAFGGGKGGGKRRPDAGQSQQSNQKAAKERESAYQNALKAIPDGKANKDPWAGAR